MRSGICVLVLALGLGAPPVMGQDEPADGWDEVRSAFAVGDFSAARDAVDRLSEAEPDSPDALYWSYRLAESPGLARELRRRMLDRTDLAPAVRDLLVLDAAWGAYAAGDFESALDLLGDIAIGEEETAATSGLLGGLCHLARGDAESGRGALAAVTPDDPDYAWARYHLGRLAHAEGDAALAARYFEMAAEAPDTPCGPEILLAEWRLALESDPQKAVRTARELQHRFPDSLPAALVAEQTQRREALQRDLTTPAPVDSATIATPDDAVSLGRFELQFAAFSDRARALSFLDAWAGRVPGLHIIASTDERGATLYRLRAGGYPDRTSARDAAEDYDDRHGLRPVPVQPVDGP